MRAGKWLVGLGVVVALLVAADFFLKNVTESRAEEQMKAVLDLRATPDVSLGGFPFTLKALSGSFPSVGVTIEDARHRGVEIEDVDVELRDVEFQLSQLLAGSQDAVRTAGGSGSAVMTQEAVSQALKQQGIAAKVTLQDGSVSIDDPRLPEPVEGTMTLEGRNVVIAAEGIPQSYSLRLPTPIEGISYESLSVEREQVVLELALAAGTLRAPS